MTKIKVAIMDNDLSWIKQIMDFIHKEPDIMVLWSATSKDTTVNHAKGADVDIILLDNRLVCDGKNVSDISEINMTKIIMMTDSTDEELTKNSISAGAVNYILK